MKEIPPEKPQTTCDECGADDAVLMGERHLCVDCYAIQSSSCAGSWNADADC